MKRNKIVLFPILMFISIQCRNSNVIKSGTENNIPSKNNMELIWNDEFDADTLNTNFWNITTGDGCPKLCGWGNQELQFYTGNNLAIQNGLLTITADKELFENREYTSGRLNTSGKINVKYGRIDVRAHLPKGQGIWPAIWMLGDNITTKGWPGCGEIDIMELRGSKPNTVCGTVHFKNKQLRHEYTKSGCFMLESENFSDDFHVFSLIWDSEKLIWLVDDKEFNRIIFQDLNLEDGPNPFLNNFYLILNLAIGGLYDGNPDETTLFPQKMEIDYVRVFGQK